MPRPDVSHERIPEILDAAAQMFSLHGIDGASMEQIADACGVSKATIYHYFKSKDALILMLVRRLFDADQPELQKMVNADSPALERLRTYSVELVKLLERNSVLIPVIAEFRARASRESAVQTVIDDYVSKYAAAFGEIIQQGQTCGEVRQAVDPHQSALAYIALVEGSLVIAFSTGQTLGAMMNGCVSVFLEGLST
jgi:AcrR family transcriptional regulator